MEDNTSVPGEAVAQDDLTKTQTLAEFAEATGAAEPIEAPAQAEPQAEPKRHRSQSQKARPADVPRIASLTKRLREAEAERDALKAAKPIERSTETTIETPKAAPVRAAATPPPVAPPSVTPANDPEPDPTKYEDLTKYFKDQAMWAARENRRLEKAEEAKTSHEALVKTENARLAKQWLETTASAKTKYPDFEQVAYAPTQIPVGSLVDAWIREHKSGPFVLYHFQKNPLDLTSVLDLPLLDQVESLTLLGQRLTTSTRTPAVTTGAAAAQTVKPVPRPPTPVRTGPMRTDDNALPDPEHVGLAGFEEAYGGHRRRG